MNDEFAAEPQAPAEARDRSAMKCDQAAAAAKDKIVWGRRIVVKKQGM
jgi:hypothetical protein